MQSTCLNDRVCIVTGATAGIGLATACGLADLGATVVLAGRDENKCAEAVAYLQQATGNERVLALLADLSAQAQVRSLASEFCDRFDRPDILINNAGAYLPRRHESAEGIEGTWAINTFSPFLLTHLLLERLVAGSPARIVNVASDMHRAVRFGWDDLEGKGRYSGARAYGQSKLALLVWTYELARRLEGTGVTANALHPGFVATEIYRGDEWMLRLARPVIRRLAACPEKGAQTSIYLASAPEAAEVSGSYFRDRKAVPSSRASYDRESAIRMWRLCSARTGL